MPFEGFWVALATYRSCITGHEKTSLNANTRRAKFMALPYYRIVHNPIIFVQKVLSSPIYLNRTGMLIWAAFSGKPEGLLTPASGAGVVTRIRSAKLLPPYVIR